MAVSRALIALWLALWASVGHAAFPASQGYNYIFGGVGGYQPTEAAAVAQYLAPRPQFSFIGCAAYVGNTATCQVRNNSSGVVSNQSMVRYPAGLVCPANATLSGSNCSCNSGYVEDAGACVLPPDPGAEHCASINGSSVKASWVTSNPSLSTRTICMSNAGYSCTSTVEGDICGSTGNGLYLCHGSGVSGGAGGGTTCTPSPEPDAPPPVGAPETDWPDAPPPGTCPGQINGITVNVPCGNTTSKGTTTSTTNDGNGNVTSKSETKATVCNAAGSCTTTTTTTTSVNGGASTTSTSSTTEGKGQFCAGNPGSAECGAGDGSSFGGGCQTSFVCTGDAVHCATAKAVNDQLCKLKEVFEMDGETRSLVDSVMAGTWTQNPADNPEVISVGVFDQTNPLGSSCPADVTFTVAGHVITVALSSMCSWLQLIGNLLVAVSLFGATLFILRRGE